MVALSEHQLKALTELSNGKVLCGGVGSGKSRTALAYYIFRVCGAYVKINESGETRPPARSVPLIVITTALKRDTFDWQSEAALFGIGPASGVNRWGLTIEVDSWNNIGKYIDVKDAFFIFDEQRVIGKGAWVKSFLKITKTNEWILLSATPGDVWLDYGPVFIANGFYKNQTDFRQQHVVWKPYSRYPQVDRYVGTRKLERLRDSILVTMPMERHTTRIVRDIEVEYDLDLWKHTIRTRFNYEENRPMKNAEELFRTLRKQINTHRSRIEELSLIHTEHTKLIVWYNYNYELEILRWYCDVNEILYSEWNGHVHQAVPQGDEWIYLVQYTAGSEGWNCTTTNAMLFYSQNYSYKVMEQSMGRIDRLNTPFTNLYYYILKSKAPIDLAISRAVRAKKKFSKAAFVKKMSA